MPTPRSTDWLLLGGLVFMWGTAFAFIKVAVATVPPIWIVAGRLGVGALALVAVVRAAGLRLPGRDAIWLRFLALGFLGNALPFFLISWGQERIDAGLAGILMGVNPLATLSLAHFLVEGERTTAARAAGFALGFAGVVLLIGPQALLELGGRPSDLARQAAVLGGALCYAANAVLARRLPPTHSFVVSAGVLLAASALVTPIAIGTGWPAAPDAASLVSVVWLGLVTTGAATIVYFRLIASAGPTFLSLTNYLVPAVAVLAGVTALGERPSWNALAGMALILSGIALGRRSLDRPAG